MGRVKNKITITVNGSAHEVQAEDETPLLYVLRNELNCVGVRYGCGVGQCGACTVIVDGKALQSCDLSVVAVAGKTITTIEGIGSLEKPHPLQQAFIDEQAAQCGYCATGIILTAKVFLEVHPHPSQDEIKQALSGHICRCGTHQRIVRAVEQAALKMRLTP